jgi:hypothetical protein
LAWALVEKPWSVRKAPFDLIELPPVEYHSIAWVQSWAASEVSIDS